MYAMIKDLKLQLDVLTFMCYKMLTVLVSSVAYKLTNGADLPTA